MADDYTAKCAALREKLAEYAATRAAVAFSGGVDSALLLKLVCRAAKMSGQPVYAVTIQGQLNAAADIAAAAALAAEYGAVSQLIKVDELTLPEIAHNQPERCYYCKRCLFAMVRDFAAGQDCGVVLDGTNADDLQVYRPGLKALRELNIKSPLAEVGFTKQQVRRLAAELGLAVATKPSSPCLATRFPYNTKLTAAGLNQAAAAERFVRARGFYNVRVRVHDKIARLELDKADFSRAVELAAELTDGLRELGYEYVTLDLAGFRSGSMDINVNKK